MVRAQLNLIRKLPGTSWGAGVNTLCTATLALLYILDGRVLHASLVGVCPNEDHQCSVKPHDEKCLEPSSQQRLSGFLSSATLLHHPSEGISVIPILQPHFGYRNSSPSPSHWTPALSPHVLKTTMEPCRALYWSPSK